MGYLQPFTIQLKILFQNICNLNINWDDSIGELLVEWKKICENLKRCEEIVIQRYFIYNLSDPVKEIYLHGFSDASHAAYAACIYLESVTQMAGKSYSRICYCRTRVIPIKKSFTIPRLELLGNYILPKLICNVYNGICDDTEVKEILYWSDSQISLTWIKDINSEFKTFAQNRLIVIRIMFIQITGNIVALMRTLLILKCGIFH